jgi:TolB protein
MSPDDSRVAFASNRAGSWDIWVVETGGGAPEQITGGLADEVHPDWSPDGSKLVFCALPPGGGQWELWIVDARTGGNKRFIGHGLFPDWMPGGDTILFQRARERGSRLFSVWTLTLVDGEPRYPTELVSGGLERAMIQPTWSPDGTRVAFVSVPAAAPAGAATPEANDTSDVWVINVDGRGKVRLTDGSSANFCPAYSPNGRVFFTTSRSGHDNIWSVLPANVPGGHPDGDWLTGGVRPAPRSWEAGQEASAKAASVTDKP